MQKWLRRGETPLQNSLLKQISIWWGPPASSECPLLYAICSTRTRSESVSCYIVSGTSEDNSNFFNKHLVSLFSSRTINPIHTYKFQKRNILLTTNHPANIMRKLAAVPCHGRVFRARLSPYSGQLQNDRHHWHNYGRMSPCHQLLQPQTTVTTITVNLTLHPSRPCEWRSRPSLCRGKRNFLGYPTQPCYLSWKGTRKPPTPTLYPTQDYECVVTTFGAASDENFVKMTSPVQWLRICVICSVVLLRPSGAYMGW